MGLTGALSLDEIYAFGFVWGGLSRNTGTRAWTLTGRDRRVSCSMPRRRSLADGFWSDHCSRVATSCVQRIASFGPSVSDGATRPPRSSGRGAPGASAPWPGRRPPKENALSGLPSKRSCNRSGGNRRNVKRSWLRCVPNWSPRGERQKGALNQPEAHTAEQALAMWASSVISAPESSTVAAAHATDNTPVVEPPYPLPIRPATAPASENPDPLPATVSTRSTLPCPVGSHWPVWCVALAVRLASPLLDARDTYTEKAFSSAPITDGAPGGSPGRGRPQVPRPLWPDQAGAERGAGPSADRGRSPVRHRPRWSV